MSTRTSESTEPAETGETGEPAEAGDAAKTAEAADGHRLLERRYRRLLTLLPPTYRSDRGEELVGVFLDNAEDGQQRPGWRETLGVGRLALRARWSAPPAPVTPAAVARAVALAGTFLFGINGIVQADFAVAHRYVLHERLSFMKWAHSTPGDPDNATYFHLYGSPSHWLIYTTFLPIVWALAFLALLGGARRIGALLTLTAAAPVAVMPFWWTDRPIQAVMSALVAVCVVDVALRSDADVLPDRAHRLAGLLAFAVTGAVVVGHEARMGYFLDVVTSPHQGSPALWLLLAALLVLAVFLGRVAPAWPVGMALLGVAPAVAVLALVDGAVDGANQVSLGYFAHYGSQILLAETGLLVVAAAMGVLGVLRGRRFGGGSVQRSA